MPKLLVETTGEFELVDFDQDTIIRHDRPTVVTASVFVSARSANGQLRVLENLTDEATDKEFETYVKDSEGDIELAVDAFKTSYSLNTQKTSSKQQNAPEVKAKGRPKNNENPEG